MSKVSEVLQKSEQSNFDLKAATKDDEQRAAFFQKLLDKALGLKSKMVVDDKRTDAKYATKYKLTYISSTKIELGTTTFRLTFNNSLFGSFSGMFVTSNVKEVEDSVRRDYIKKYPTS